MVWLNTTWPETLVNACGLEELLYWTLSRVCWCEERGLLGGDGLWRAFRAHIRWDTRMHARPVYLSSLYTMRMFASPVSLSSPWTMRMLAPPVYLSSLYTIGCSLLLSLFPHHRQMQWMSIYNSRRGLNHINWCQIIDFQNPALWKTDPCCLSQTAVVFVIYQVNYLKHSAPSK